MNLIRIVHQLRLASGSNAKLKILRQNSDNEMWKTYLQATYDQRITYGVSAPSTFDFDVTYIEDYMFECLNELASRQLSGNAAKKMVKGLSTYYGEIPRLVLSRSIKAGVSTGLINRAYPGLIHLFKTMKGKDVPIEEYPVLSSIKYDGVKVFAFVRPGKVTLTTSSGAEFILTSLIAEYSDAPYGVYEGELVYKEGKQEHRTTISGKLLSLLAGTINDIRDYTHVVYDYVSLEDWDMKTSHTVYEDRYSILISGLEQTVGDSMYIKPIAQALLNSEEEVEKFFNSLLEEGWEGSMHRYGSDFYEWTGEKRTERLIKKKAIKTCVLTCKGATPHSNPDKGNIGSLLCEGHVGNLYISVNVGSGLSKFDIQFTEDRYIGKQIEIIYNTIIKSDLSYSLFLPRYKRIKGEL